ncbi:hypothetical protein [Ralstonia syzygii]
MKTEMRTTMQLLGCVDVRLLGASCVISEAMSPVP